MKRLLLVVRLAALVAVVARLRQAAHRRPPVTLADVGGAPPASISVVVPARDEERRLGPLLRALAADATVTEVLVVDDRSSDATARLAELHGAMVVPGAELPDGWVGKPWALQQGLSAATGTWVWCLDADVVPSAGLGAALVARAEADGWDLLSVGARFSCRSLGERWLHPALLATLVTRFGPPGTTTAPAAHRTLANGQCLVARRHQLAAAGGFGLAAGHLTDDVALARALAARGWRVGFLDALDAVEVRMHESAGELWREWGRSLPMADTTSRPWQLADLAVVVATQGLPVPRLLAGRGDAVDVAMVLLRLGTLAGTARAYRPRGPAYWLSPLADPLAALRLAAGTARPRRTWRGRTYPTG